ncbi:hypothetical protein Tco_1255983 [Tanacetum coccineum]
MSSATSAVTYTSVYTDSKPGKAFWGADDEEVSEEGILRVIVLGYDGLPIKLVAPPSPDYIPGPEDPQTPPVPQDEDEREPMFIQAHDPDYVPEPIYPDVYPFGDEHEFLDPEEYEDDETVDGLVDYPMDGGDDGDDDDGDSSRDDANDEDEDEEDEEDKEEEHLAPADSTTVIPDLPVTTPDSISLTTRGRWLRTSVHDLLHHPINKLLTITPLQGSALIASTQALIDAVTAALPSPPLPPSLYIPPPVDRRDDISESEQPPRKRLYLSTIGSRYEIGESSTARLPVGIRDVGYGIRGTWVDPAEAVPEIAPITVGEVNTRVTELAELHEHDTQDLYALLEDAQDRDNMDGGGGGICFPRGLGSLDRIESGDPSGASDPP